jgi:hypothetical protein
MECGWVMWGRALWSDGWKKESDLYVVETGRKCEQ